MAEVQRWPEIIWMVRHGESAGNIAREAALAAGLPSIDLSTRDVDVPLSALGQQQSDALGRWFGKMPEDQRPTVVLTSPYLRARATAEIVLKSAGIERENVVFTIDERLREKEFGILDRLTRLGIQQKFPDEANRFSILGKFYYRPPGGESWCDVILRLRSLIEMIVREYRQERVLIVAHQVVVLSLRYLLERMTEDEILAIDRAGDLANCSVTAYEFDRSLGIHGKLALRLFNFVAPLEEEGAPITTEPDIPLASK